VCFPPLFIDSFGDYFAHYGRIKSSNVIIDPVTGNSRYVERFLPSSLRFLLFFKLSGEI